MHDEVKKSIAQGNGGNLRYFFVDCFNIDPTFAAYQEDFDYCRQHNVFEPQRRLTPFRSDEHSWDKDYWLNLKADLQDNFSEERMLHMINVAKFIYRDKIKNSQHNKATVQQMENIDNHNEDNKKYRIEKIPLKDDPERKQEIELQNAREEFARQEEAKKKALARPNVPNKYVGGQNVKKSQGIPLLPISIIIALVIVVLLLLLK